MFFFNFISFLSIDNNPISFNCRTSNADQYMYTHKQTGSHICELCGLNFSMISRLKAHILNEHNTTISNNKLSLQCDICKKWSKNIFTLQKHKKNMHSLRHVQCVHCEKYYTSETRLRVHVRIAHEDPTKFKCNQCDNCYNTNEKLKVFIKYF